MIKRILNNIITFYRIPYKILKKIDNYYKLKKFDLPKIEKEQNHSYSLIGLDRIVGLENLNNLKKDHNLTNKSLGLISEHEILFSSLSLNKNYSIKNILEIGTYDGYNAFMLSCLFPEAKIDTFDLPEKENCSINNYNKNYKDFFKKRLDLISKKKNINFIQQNSVKLLNHYKKYDLIWVDGDHVFPTVCIDIINSLNLINEKGLIVCDDAHMNNKKLNKNKMRYSSDTYEILNTLEKESIIKFDLIYKRLTFENITDEIKKKFIAIIKKV